MRHRSIAVLGLLGLFLLTVEARALPRRNQGDGGAPNDSSEFNLGNFLEDLWEKFTGKFKKNKGGDTGSGGSTGGSSGGSTDSGSGSTGGSAGGSNGGSSGGSSGGSVDPTGGTGGSGGTGGTGGSGGSTMGGTGGSGGSGGSGGTAGGTGGTGGGSLDPNAGQGGSGSNAGSGGTPPAPPRGSPPPMPPTDLGGSMSAEDQPKLFASAGTQGQIIGGSDNFKGVMGGSNSDPVADAKAAAEAAAAQHEAEAKFYSQRADVGAVEAAPGAATQDEIKASAYTRSAKTKMDMGDYAEAIRDATAALKLAPGAAGALSVRASAYNMTGRYKEAIADIMEALKTRPDDPVLWENLAWANLRSGDYAGAIKAADRAIKLNPKSALSLVSRAYAKQMLGDMKGYADDLTAAAALDSRFAENARLAREGKRVYAPEGDDASYLLGAAAAVTAAGKKMGLGKAVVPVAVGGVSLLVLGAGAIGFFAARRRKSEPERRPVGLLTPLAPEAARPDASKGGLLAGKYRLEGVIGRGGMGEVRRAKDSTLGRPVAIKTLSSSLAVGAEGEQWRARLRQEAMTVAAVHHPGIVDIYEIVEAEGALHLVFEYIEGTTVASMLVQKGRMSPGDCARLLAPVCDALEYAHGRGLVHRDLKPGNIMVTSTNHVKLLDFGIARAQGEMVPAAALAAAAPGLRFDRTTTVAGTPVYMPPEADQGLVGPPGDVYSLGVCLYEMLTGRRPYPDNATTVEKAALTVTPASAYGGVPPAFDALIAAAMSSDPAKRPAGPAAFKAALEAASK